MATSLLKCALGLALLDVVSGFDRGVTLGAIEVKDDGKIGAMPIMRREVEPELHAAESVDPGGITNFVACPANYGCGEAGTTAICACCVTQSECTSLQQAPTNGPSCTWAPTQMCEPAPIYVIPGSATQTFTYPTQLPASAASSATALSTDYIDISSYLTSPRPMSSGSGVSIFLSATQSRTSANAALVDFATASSYSNVPNKNIAIQQLNSTSVVFQIYTGTSASQCGAVVIPGRISVWQAGAQPFSVLCTVALNGTMKVWQDGALVTTVSAGSTGCTAGRAPNFALSTLTFAKSFVGRSNFLTRDLFKGAILDLRVWNEVLSWSQAQGTWER